MLHDLFLERYPDIAFFLSLKDQNEGKACAQERGRAPGEGTIQLPKLEGIDTVYFYGLGNGAPYRALKTWLSEKPERLLLILEDDLAAIGLSLEDPLAVEWVSHPQVHLAYLPQKRQWRAGLDQLAEEFPSDRMVFAALPEQPKRRVAAMRLMLMRKCGAVHAKLTEALLSDRLLKNLAPNFKRLPEAFFVNTLRGEFKGIPAVICGAGPSLKAAIPLLKTLENRALIFAGGSTVAALTSQGVQPHLAMALDPNPEEFGRLRASDAFEVPFLYSNRLLPHVFATTNGPKGYIRSHTGGPAEFWIESQLGLDAEAIGPELGPEAMSVTTLALATAYELGCDPIILVGVDLAYTGMQRYAAGVLEDSRVTLSKLKQEKKATERILRRKDRKGKTIYTLVKWVMESAAMSAYAKNHPKARFINATEEGLGFTHIAYQPLEEVVRNHLQNSWDLHGHMHAAIQKSRLHCITPQRIEELFQEIKRSAERSLTLCEEMLGELKTVQEDTSRSLETGKMVILAADFEEEIAFEYLLQTLGPAIERILQRKSLYLKEEEKRSAAIEKEIVKWQHYQTALKGLCTH